MFKNIGTVLMAAVFMATIAAAQEKKPADKVDVKEAAAKPAPEPPALPINVKIEVSISDQTGNNPPAKKVVTMIASDRQPTNVRSSSSVPVKSTVFGNPTGPTASYTYKTVQINVDARPAIVQKEPNKISVSFGLEYLPTSRVTDQEGMEPGLTSWNERLSVILESGKPMVISQAADPTSDRKITVEITATILK